SAAAAVERTYSRRGGELDGNPGGGGVDVDRPVALGFDDDAHQGRLETVLRGAELFDERMRIAPRELRGGDVQFRVLDVNHETFGIGEPERAILRHALGLGQDFNRFAPGNEFECGDGVL